MSESNTNYFDKLLSIVDDLKIEHEHGGELIITINPRNDTNKSIVMQLYPRTTLTFLTSFGVNLEEAAKHMIDALIYNDYIDR